MSSGSRVGSAAGVGGAAVGEGEVCSLAAVRSGEGRGEAGLPALLVLQPARRMKINRKGMNFLTNIPVNLLLR